MSQSDPQISALIASRICHDLISPIGAVANGLELLELAGTPHGCEMKLVSDSARNATDRIRYFRLAFGAATPDQSVSAEEIGDLLTSVVATHRLGVRFNGSGSFPRAEAKALLLAAMCLESACPGRGEIALHQEDGQWCAEVVADKVVVNPGHWAALSETGVVADLQPAAIHFLLLPDVLRAMGRPPSVHHAETVARIRF